jgi:hypothetical protein
MKEKFTVLVSNHQGDVDVHRIETDDLPKATDDLEVGDWMIARVFRGWPDEVPPNEMVSG